MSWGDYQYPDGYARKEACLARLKAVGITKGQNRASSDFASQVRAVVVWRGHTNTPIGDLLKESIIAFGGHRTRRS